MKYNDNRKEFCFIPSDLNRYSAVGGRKEI